MIHSFRCKRTRSLYEHGVCPGSWRAFETAALRKLDMIDAANELGDLRSPPGNRLEKLAGDRDGQWSIRINGQWRVCFRWSENGPEDVEIVDYH
jgi:proteic killer suppression protein